MPAIKGKPAHENSIKALREANQPKFGEKMDKTLQLLLTSTGKEKLNTLAKEMGYSKSELVERIARGEFELVRIR